MDENSSLLRGRNIRFLEEGLRRWEGTKIQEEASQEEEEEEASQEEGGGQEEGKWR